MKKLSCIFCFTLLLLSACSSQSDRIAVEQDFDQSKAAKTRVSLGLTYLKNGNFSQAKFNLDKALQYAPRSADAHFALAYYYQQVEEHEAAEKAYQTAMDLEPRNADIANSYGAFLCQRGKYAEAKRYFLKAVNSDNYISSAETYENLALCSQSHGELEDATLYLRMAVNHQPGRAKSLYMLAQLLAESNKWIEAKDVLRRLEKVSQVSPNSLLLASEIENALGNVQLAKGYGEMLLRMFPSDPATATYLQQRKTAAVGATPLGGNSSKPPMLAPLPVVETPAKNELTSQVSKTISAKSPVIKEADILPKVADNAALINTPVKTPKTTITQELQIDELASKNAINKGIESSQNKGVITHLAQKNQEIEHAEKVVVEKNEPLDGKKPTFHTVLKKENLYRISLLYNIKMQRLIEWNNLPDASSIYIGKKLLLVDPKIVDPENQE